MKKFILLSLIMMVGFMLPVESFAQSTDPVVNWLSEALGEYFTTLAVFSPFVVVISGYINRVLEARGAAAQVISWIVAVGAGFIASWLNLGIFNDVGVIMTIVTSLAGGLVANGIYDIKLVQQILDTIKAIVPRNA